MLSVVTTLITQRLLDAPPATAQGDGVGEVRASAFVLVRPDGMVIGRLQPGGLGNGQLALYDASGARRMVLAGVGNLVAYDTDGETVRFRAGYTTDVSMAGPPFSGVQLDPGGMIGVLPHSP